MRLKNFAFVIFVILFSSCSGSVKEAMKKGHIPTNTFRETIHFEETLGLCIVTGQIEGESYRFLFDTGAPMIISPELQKKLKYKKVGSNTIRDSNGGSYKQPLVQMKEIVIGEIPFQNITAYVIELNSNPVIKCMNLDGIIGSNLMRHCTWQIDFGQQNLTFTSSSLAQSSSAKAIIIPFTTNDQYSIYVQLKSEKSTLNNIKVDYGSSGSLSIPNKSFTVLKERSEFDSLRVKKGFKQSGLFGGRRKFSEEMGLIDMKLGSVEMDDFLISNEGKGLLGTEFLSKHLVTIDWNTKQIGFEHPKPFDEDEWSTFGFGLGESKDGSVVIQSVHKNSLAEKLGIQVNNVVLQVNDYKMSVSNGFCDYILANRDTLQVLQLTYRDSLGVKKEVSLKKQKLF